VWHVSCPCFEAKSFGLGLNSKGLGLDTQSTDMILVMYAVYIAHDMKHDRINEWFLLCEENLWTTIEETAKAVDSCDGFIHPRP